MVLEVPVLLCVTGPDFFVNKKLSQKWGKWAKNRVFLDLLENLVIYFF